MRRLPPRLSVRARFDTSIQAHQETQALLQGYETNGDSPKLKAWAKATLPTVEMHLKKIQAMA